MTAYSPGDSVRVTRDQYGYRIDGQYFRRVTGLLKGIPKPALMMWAAKTTAEYAVAHKEAWTSLPDRDAIDLLKRDSIRKRDTAGERGTAIHRAIESYLGGQSLPEGLNADEYACARAVTELLQAKVRKVLAVEIVVFHPELQYAGTADLLAEDHEGDRWLLDWKTSKDIYNEYAVQVTAYAHAPYAVVRTEGDPDDFRGVVCALGPKKVERLGVVHVTPGTAALHEVVRSARLWTVFRAAAFVKLWQADTDAFSRGSPRERVFLPPEEFLAIEPKPKGEAA